MTASRTFGVIRSVCCALALVALAGCTTSLEPLTRAEIAERSAIDRAALARARLPTEHPLTLGEAIARALAGNIDLRVARLDAAIARGVVDLSDLARLPNLIRSAGYTSRDPPGAAADKVPGDKIRQTFSTELSWNVLDFGISYLRARQAANAALIAEERRRRVANAIVNEVRLAFWQAYLGGRRLPRLRALAAEIERAMQRSNELAGLKLQDPLVALNYQDGLIELQRQAKSYETEIAQARLRLMRLLNVYPDGEPTLAAGDAEPIAPLRAIDRDILEEVALATRGELREADYNRRNSRLDVISSVVQMAPSLRLRAANVFDSSSSLRDNHWLEYGYTLSFSFLGLATGHQRAQIARMDLSSAELRRLTLSLAVLEQVALARESLEVLEEDHRLAHRASTVRQRIWEIRRMRLPFGESDELERSRAAVAALDAEIREDRAYAALQRAYGSLLASLGIDQFPPDLDLGDPAAAARRISGHLREIPERVRTLSAEIAAARAAAPSATGPAATGR